jgi:hypothetical protein
MFRDSRVAPCPGFPDYSDDRPNHLLTDYPERDVPGSRAAPCPGFPDYSDDRPNHLLTDSLERGGVIAADKRAKKHRNHQVPKNQSPQRRFDTFVMHPGCGWKAQVLEIAV